MEHILNIPYTVSITHTQAWGLRAINPLSLESYLEICEPIYEPLSLQVLWKCKNLHKDMLVAQSTCHISNCSCFLLAVKPDTVMIMNNQNIWKQTMQALKPLRIILYYNKHIYVHISFSNVLSERWTSVGEQPRWIRDAQWWRHAAEAGSFCREMRVICGSVREEEKKPDRLPAYKFRVLSIFRPLSVNLVKGSSCCGLIAKYW